MEAKKWVLIAVGFVAGIVVAKVLIRPRVVTLRIPIPERNIPVEGPKVREVQRNPQIHGRREIF